MSQVQDLIPMHKRVADLAWRLGEELRDIRGGTAQTVKILHSPPNSRPAVVAGGEAFTVPAYTVGSNKLQIFLDGVFCVPGTDAAKATYAEVGTAGTTSTTISFHQAVPVGYDIFARVG